MTFLVTRKGLTLDYYFLFKSILIYKISSSVKVMKWKL